MIAGFFDGPEIIVVLIIVLVLFGGSQIPKLARNLGTAQKEFKKGISEAHREDADIADRRTPPPASPPPSGSSSAPTTDL